jgi:uncharacterized alkaline shock family protein YloU
MVQTQDGTQSTAVTSPGSSRATVRTAGTSGVAGVTKIADSVVARIAGLATREVSGVHDTSTTGLTQSFGNIAGRVTKQEHLDRGVGVQVGEVECIIDLNIIVDYEASIPQVAEAVRRNINERLRAMTGLETKEVNIHVADLYFPDQDQSRQPAVQ